MKQRTFQFGANLADQNVAAKNPKSISDGKFYSEVYHGISAFFLFRAHTDGTETFPALGSI